MIDEAPPLYDTPARRGGEGLTSPTPAPRYDTPALRGFTPPTSAPLTTYPRYEPDPLSRRGSSADDPPWVDQLNQHLLLTVQALQALHSALDGKFTRPPGAL